MCSTWGDSAAVTPTHIRTRVRFAVLHLSEGHVCVGFVCVCGMDDGMLVVQTAGHAVGAAYYEPGEPPASP